MMLRHLITERRLAKASRIHAANTAHLRDLAWQAGDVALGVFYGEQLTEQQAMWAAIVAEREQTKAAKQSVAR